MFRSTLLALVFFLALYHPGAFAQDLSFSTYMAEPVDLMPWATSVLMVIGTGALIFATGGAASPIVTSIGSWVGTTIGGFHGAAATSYGLALIGGGSIASGGGGIALGVAILSAAVAVGEQAAKGIAKITLEQALQVEQSIAHIQLPLPLDYKGRPEIKKAQEVVRATLAVSKGETTPTAGHARDVFAFAAKVLEQGKPIRLVRKPSGSTRLIAVERLPAHNLLTQATLQFNARSIAHSKRLAESLICLDQVKCRVATVSDLVSRLETNAAKGRSITGPAVVWLFSDLAQNAEGGLTPKSNRYREVLDHVFRKENDSWIIHLASTSIDLLSAGTNLDKVSAIKFVSNIVDQSLEDNSNKARWEMISLMRHLKIAVLNRVVIRNISCRSSLFVDKLFTERLNTLDGAVKNGTRNLEILIESENKKYLSQSLRFWEGGNDLAAIKKSLSEYIEIISKLRDARLNPDTICKTVS